MTQNYDELLKRLDNDSRYSQGNCLKCAKGFENHEYHCWGPETEGCMASQKELQITVLQWKKERKQASTAIRTLQAERDAAYNQAIADWEVLQTARIATLEAALREAREALDWYREQSRLARLIHSEGDKGRHAISVDGGVKAVSTMVKIDEALE